MFYKITKTVAIFTMLFSCLLACENSSKADEVTVTDWAKSHISDTDTLMCKKTIGSNSFFVALKDSTVKTGYLLDVGSVLDKPYTYIFSWSFHDENGNFLITNKLSENVSKQYVTMNNTVYSESIDITALNLESANKLVVTVITKTYVDRDDVPEKLDDVVLHDKNAKFLLCEIEL